MAERFKIYCEQPAKVAFGPTEEQQQQQLQRKQALITNYKTNSIVNSTAVPTNQNSTANATSNSTITSQVNSANQLAQLKLVQIQQQHQYSQLQQQAAKREPLGVRQTTDQAAIAAALAASKQVSGSQNGPSSQQSTTSDNVTLARGHITNNGNINTGSGSTSNSSSLITCDEEQENDISMASLGSDFVPSIIHESFNEDESSFKVYDDCDSDQEHATNSDECNEELEIDDELDHEMDEDLEAELASAFRKHDESQLFKSIAYIDEINSYLKDMERNPSLRALPNYMEYQEELDSSKRTILINWLAEVSEEYNLQAETLFISTSLVDRFLSEMAINTGNFQLLGVAAMFIASKYEEIYPPNLHQFVEITDETYSGTQIRQMEQVILKTLDFRISYPTISFFLREIFAFNKFSRKVYDLAEYLCHLSLLADRPFLEYLPSEIALASVILAAHQLNSRDNITPELKSSYDQSNQDQLKRRSLPKGKKICDLDRRVYTVTKDLPFCIESLRLMQERVFTKSSQLPRDLAIVAKYSLDSHNCVALLPPPTVEDLFACCA